MTEEDFVYWFKNTIQGFRHDKDFFRDKFTFLSDIFITLDPQREELNPEDQNGNAIVPEGLKPVPQKDCLFYSDYKCQGYYLQVSSDLDSTNSTIQSNSEFLKIISNSDYLNVFFFGFFLDPDKLVSFNLLLEKKHYFFTKKEISLIQMSPKLFKTTYDWVLYISFHIICIVTFILFLLFNIIKIVVSKRKLHSLLEIFNYENFFLIILFSQYFLQLFYFIKYFKIRTKNYLLVKQNFHDIRLETYEFYQIHKMIASIFGGLFINLMVTGMIFFLKKYFFIIGKFIYEGYCCYCVLLWDGIKIIIFVKTRKFYEFNLTQN
jgi:hypothetical protein